MACNNDYRVFLVFNPYRFSQICFASSFLLFAASIVCNRFRVLFQIPPFLPMRSPKHLDLRKLIVLNTRHQAGRMADPLRPYSCEVANSLGWSW